MRHFQGYFHHDELLTLYRVVFKVVVDETANPRNKKHELKEEVSEAKSELK